MKVVNKAISLPELDRMAKQSFGNMVKAVVDIKLGIMAVDGELHADEEALLVKNGSKQADLWGINLYPGLPADDWIEFDSMINLRPLAGNTTRTVEDKIVRKKISDVVSKLVAG